MSKKKPSDSSRSLLDQRLRETASEIFEDVEHASDEMIRELREGLESISKSMSNAAKVAQETSKYVSNKVREIESKDVLLKVKEIGIDYSQGYFIGKPDMKFML